MITWLEGLLAAGVVGRWGRRLQLSLSAVFVFASGVFAADMITVGTRVGTVTVPRDWQAAKDAKTEVEFRSPDQTSTFRLYVPENQDLDSFLHERAAELQISGYTRNVSDDFLSDVKAMRGQFVLGTIPAVSGEESPGLSQSGLLSGGVAAEYRIVVAYAVRSGKLYALEGTTRDVEKGSLVLSDMQRSWRPPKQ